MANLENSSRFWDRLWTNRLTNFYSNLPFSQVFENFVRRQLHFKAIDRLLESVSLANKEIFELGSGTGSNSLYLAKTRNLKSVTLLDFSEKALDRVRENSFPCQVIKIKEDLLNFSPKKAYGFVHSTGLVEHFAGEHRLLVVKKHIQFTKSGGLVMIWVPIFSPAFNLIEKINRYLGIKEIPFTKKELKFLFQKSGLEIIREGETVFGALYGILAKKH